MKKLFSILTIMTFFVTASNAQFYAFGGDLTYISGGIVKNLGLHANAEFEVSDKFAISGHLGAFFPSSQDEVWTLSAKSSSASPSNIDVPVVSKIGGIQLGVDGKAYFFTEHGDDFGFYGMIGMGILSFGYNPEIQVDYDPVYGLQSREDLEAKERFSNFTVNFGLGAEVMIGRDALLFFESKLNVPSNQDSQGNAVDVQIPRTFQLNLGYKYLL